MYTGYVHMNLTDSQLNKLYQDDNFLLDKLYENQYGILYNMNDDFIDIRLRNQGEIKPVKWKPIDNSYHGLIKPRNLEQQLAFNLLQNDNIPVKVLTGTHGSFKTGSMIIHALDKIQKGKFNKLVWVRNNFNVAGTNDVGYLAGSLEEKLRPWAGPLMDHCGGQDGLTGFINEGLIEIVHIGFLRGRSIDNAILMCSEAQNLTVSHIALLLGRIGEGSQLWMEGDIHGQQDHKMFLKSPGIKTCIDRLSGNELFGYVHLIKTERSQVAEMANIFNDLLD